MTKEAASALPGKLEQHEAVVAQPILPPLDGGRGPRGLCVWLDLSPGNLDLVEAHHQGDDERGCDLLPYPWGDRLEATLGNFGLWVQITLAIVAFRLLVWLRTAVLLRVWTAMRRTQGRRANSDTG